MTEDELIEAKDILAAINKYADEEIYRQIDADDLTEAASSAFFNSDLDLLRVFKQTLGTDTFSISYCVNVLRKQGYSDIASFFTAETENILHSVNDCLMSATGPTATNIFGDNASKIAAYAMANPDRFALIENAIRERRVTQFEDVYALVHTESPSSLSDGVL